MKKDRLSCLLRSLRNQRPKTRERFLAHMLREELRASEPAKPFVLRDYIRRPPPSDPLIVRFD